MSPNDLSLLWLLYSDAAKHNSTTYCAVLMGVHYGLTQAHETFIGLSVR